MLAIAGAVLINAGCVLMASGRDTADFYIGQRLFVIVGSGLLASDLFLRVQGAVRKARARPVPPNAP
jgi:hypothetical protein